MLNSWIGGLGLIALIIGMGYGLVWLTKFAIEMISGGNPILGLVLLGIAVILSLAALGGLVVFWGLGRD
jgi:hypothetical protein